MQGVEDRVGISGEQDMTLAVASGCSMSSIFSKVKSTFYIETHMSLIFCIKT